MASLITGTDAGQRLKNWKIYCFLASESSAIYWLPLNLRGDFASKVRHLLFSPFTTSRPRTVYGYLINDTPGSIIYLESRKYLFRESFLDCRVDYSEKSQPTRIVSRIFARPFERTAFICRYEELPLRSHVSLNLWLIIGNFYFHGLLLTSCLDIFFGTRVRNTIKNFGDDGLMV